MKKFLLSSLFLCTFTSVYAQTPVLNTQSYTDSALNLRVLSGELTLPTDGLWRVQQPPSDAFIHEVYLQAPPEAKQQGQRLQKIQQQRRIQQDSYTLYAILNAYRLYAKAHGDKGPPSLAELKTLKDHRLKALEDDAVFILPNLTLQRDPKTKRWNHQDTRLLALELQPYVDDGKHWVLLANGRTERRTIDTELLQRYNLAIQPQTTASSEPPPDTAHYKIYALGTPTPDQSIALTLNNSITEQNLEVTWNLDSIQPGKAELLSQWATLRAAHWAPMLAKADAPVLRYWLAQFDALYHTKNLNTPIGNRSNRRVSLLNVLGGRAAIRETLQMQALGTGNTGLAKRKLAITDLKGVEVKSHPFENMLKAVKPGQLSLAEQVPQDRFFVYFQKPDTLLSWLDQGSAFIANMGANLSRNNLDYDLKSRYLTRLGIDEAWVRLLLKHNVAKEIGVILPDLFLIDGTDVTIIVRITNNPLVKPALKLLGMSGLGSDIHIRTTASGDRSYWSLQDDLIVFSSNQNELKKVLALRQNQGRNSLGQSAEFRYMLNRLPIETQTAVYAYFSDPFIRRLVGPQTKIAQLRRLQARTELERLSAGALLYRLDRHTEQPSIETLARLNYIPRYLAKRDYRLYDNGIAKSSTYGTLRYSSTLLDQPVDAVSQKEAKLYRNYVENYSRFWRQFFDPIAMRLNDSGDGELELSTYILPLINSSIYDSLRGLIHSHESNIALAVPQLESDPVLMLSLNGHEELWVGLIRGILSGGLQRYTGIAPTIFDHLGPGIHIAIEDADPVLTLGSGDIFGAFGGEMMSAGDTWMVMVPMVMSALTRPTKILIELNDPEAVSTLLKKTSTQGVSLDNREFRGNFYKIDGRDAWVYDLDFFGLIKLRLGVEVQDRYLILSNIPWSQRPLITQTTPAPLNGVQLTVTPGAGHQQLSGLFAAATAQQRQAAMNGIGYLYPLLATETSDMAKAAAKHAELFGFHPIHPTPGQWLWTEGQLQSTRFGSVTYQKQPEHQTGDREFGLLQTIQQLSLNMQLEDSGLRASVRWRLREE